MRYLLIACGGAVGALLQYAVSMGVFELTGRPYWLGTLVVNAAGCFLIGVLATVFAQTAAVNTDFKLMILVGLLGGFTTFSSYSLEIVNLYKEKNYVAAISYFAASNGIGIAAAFLGCRLVGKLWGASTLS